MEEKILQKYDSPVPRYTSYPPANYFGTDFTGGQFLEAVSESNHWEPEAVSLYFHIPFCKQMCLYCGCNSRPMPERETVKGYFGALKSELRLISRLIDKNRKVTQVHFGGGTPNSVEPKYLEEIMEILHERFSFVESPEIAIECNPAYLDHAYVKRLVAMGFNRVSLGIQDFSVQVLNNVNREASYMPVNSLVELLRSEAPEMKINLDFIYGLPGQTVGSFLDTIREAIQIRPDRLVTFSYAHVPWVNDAQKALEDLGLPDKDEKASMYYEAAGLLKQHGYKAIGLDHFVTAEDDLYRALQSGRLHRNFQGYASRETTGQVYAFGVSAISQLRGVYAQNTKSPEEYIRELGLGIVPVRKGYVLNQSEIRIREVITELMCNRELHWDAIARRLGTTAVELCHTVRYNEKALREFKQDGVIEYDETHIRVTEAGAMLVRNVAASLDPLVSPGNKNFSKSF